MDINKKDKNFFHQFYSELALFCLLAVFFENQFRDFCSNKFLIIFILFLLQHI